MDKMVINKNGREHMIWGLASYPDLDNYTFCQKHGYTKYSLEEIHDGIDMANDTNRRFLEFLVEHDAWMVEQYDENWADFISSTVNWTPTMLELEAIRTDFDTNEVHTEVSKRHSNEAFPVDRWVKDCKKLNSRVTKMEKLFEQIKRETASN